VDTTPEATPPAEPEPHRHRDVAEAFGREAERYDRTRPRYPDALVDAVVTASPGPDVLDVGCGTGIAARQFQAAGCRVLGIDPDPRMAELARRTGVEAEVAAFEAWDPAGRAFDAVVAGQAWHWVDPVAGAAKAARLLRPGGRLAVFWNAFQPPTELMEAVAAVYRRLTPELTFFLRLGPGVDGYSALLTAAEDGIRQVGAYGDPERWRFDWHRHYTRDEWLDQVPSFAGHGHLAPDTLTELLAQIGAAIDAVGGGFTMDYAAVAVTAVRPDPEAR
jgi:SAM-dependent methyltransferase